MPAHVWIALVIGTFIGYRTWQVHLRLKRFDAIYNRKHR